MNTQETTKVTVTEIPTATLERLQAAAVAEGISSSFPTVIRWVLKQYYNGLDDDGADTPPKE